MKDGMPDPISYSQRLISFEIAQDTLCFMMARLTALTDQEEKKAAPSSELIAQWRKEFDKLHDELYYLRMSDDAEFQRIAQEYSPILKADYERRSAENSAPSA